MSVPIEICYKPENLTVYSAEESSVENKSHISVYSLPSSEEKPPQSNATAYSTAENSSSKQQQNSENEVYPMDMTIDEQKPVDTTVFAMDTGDEKVNNDPVYIIDTVDHKPPHPPTDSAYAMETGDEKSQILIYSGSSASPFGQNAEDPCSSMTPEHQQQSKEQLPPIGTLMKFLHFPRYSQL